MAIEKQKLFCLYSSCIMPADTTEGMMVLLPCVAEIKDL